MKDKTIFIIKLPRNDFAVEDKENSRILFDHLDRGEGLDLEEIKMLAKSHSWNVVSRKFKGNEWKRYYYE